MAAACADGDVEYESDIESKYDHLDSDGLKKPAAKSTKGKGGASSTTTVAFGILKRFERHEILSSLKPVCAPLFTPTKDDEDVYEDNELFQDDTTEDNAMEDMVYYHVITTGRWGHSLSSEHDVLSDLIC